MPRTKISEFSVTPGDNTDIDGINIAEGCAPSGINDAIRELMAQLKDFQSGAAGDSITVVGTLAAKGTSSAAADLKLYEDTDNGTNYVGFIAPASIASNVQWTLPSADGSSGQALQTNGSGTLSFATLGISAGGTGQTTANAAFNALAPSQTSNAGRYLKTDGTNTSWDLLDISTADITGTLATTNGGTGLTSFTANGVVYASSTSALSTGSALTFDGSNLQIGSQGDLRLGDSDNSNWVAFQAPATVASNVTWTLPSADGTNGQALTTNGSGTLSWATAGGGSSISAGNSSVAVTDTGSNGTITFTTDGSERMRLDASGNLGLGVTPSAWRTGGGEKVFQFDTGSVYCNNGNDVYVNSNWFLNSSAQTIYLESDFASSYAQASGQHQWYTAASGTAGNAISFTQAMTLDASGRLGIGTTSPTVPLEVAQSATTYTAIRLANTTAGNNGGQVTFAGAGNTDMGWIRCIYDGVMTFGTWNGSSVVERARITSGGLFCFNAAGDVYSADAPIIVNGTGLTRSIYSNINGTSTATHISFANGNGVVGSITTNGSATAFNTSSDYRLKDNPQPLSGSGAFIDALKPKTWNWKADGSRGVGFIAHEVQEVSPGSVVGEKDAVDADGNPIMQGMEYGSAEFIANIIAELQSLRARVAQLEAK